MFWRRKEDDDFDFDKLTTQEMTRPEPQHDPFANDAAMDSGEKSLFPDREIGSRSAFSQSAERLGGLSSLQQQQGFGMSGNKDLDLINSKLDTLKAMLQSLDQRLNSIEQTVKGEQKQKLW